MLKNSCVKGYSFFPGFSLPRYFLVALLRFTRVALGSWAVAVRWCCCGGGSSAQLPHSSCEPGSAERCVRAEHGVGTKYNLQVIFIFKYQ